MAGMVVVLAGLHAARGFAGFVFLSVFFALLCAPLHGWMLRRGIGSGPALALLGVVLLLAVAVLALAVAGAVASLASQAGHYRDALAAQLDQLRQRLDAAGLPSRPLEDVDPGTVVDALAAVAGGVAGFVGSLFYVLLAVLFLVADGPGMFARLGGWLGDGHPLVARLAAFGREVRRAFGVRTVVNAITAAGITVGLVLLGVGLAPVWGALVFFLSYVPYLGMLLAGTPPVVMALAGHGPGRALAVVAMIAVVNVAAENVLMPRMAGRTLSLSPFVVYVSFAFWTWLLGAPGALLSVALTQLVVALLDADPETRGLARVLASPPAGSERDSAASSGNGA